jgi:hypothetical protein
VIRRAKLPVVMYADKVGHEPPPKLKFGAQFFADVTEVWEGAPPMPAIGNLAIR